MIEGWCMKCKQKVEMIDAEETIMKNGRKAMKGRCECGTKMFKMGGIKNEKDKSEEER